MEVPVVQDVHWAGYEHEQEGYSHAYGPCHDVYPDDHYRSSLQGPMVREYETFVSACNLARFLAKQQWRTDRPESWMTSWILLVSGV